MDPRIAEIAELQRLWDEDSDEFESRRRVSKWGERIKERVVDLISTENADAIEDGLVFLEQNPRFFRTGYFTGESHEGLLKSSGKTCDNSFESVSIPSTDLSFAP